MQYEDVGQKEQNTKDIIPELKQVNTKATDQQSPIRQSL
jgi:hypothetical protein